MKIIYHLQEQYKIFDDSPRYAKDVNLILQNKVRKRYWTQTKFAYNSNHIEGSKLTEEQTRMIYETKTFISNGEETIQYDDVIETGKHFRLFDY